MKNLTIRFIDGKDIVSKLITWTTDSLWCHTEALSRDGHSWIGAHAGTGVQARPLDWTVPARERRYEIPVFDAQFDAAHKFLESREGTKYDYMDIVGLAIHKRTGLSEHEIICSALMTQFLQVACIQPLNVLPNFDNLVTPETLHLSPVFLGRCSYSFQDKE